MSDLTYVIVLFMGLGAGFVDAIAGGGGLIMLPGLLLTGLPVGSAIATNKLCGTFGALTSSLTFARAKQIDWPACVTFGLPAIIGAYIGSRSVSRLPTAWAEPVVIVLMAIITLVVLFKPDFGTQKGASSPAIKQPGAQLALGVVAGGIIGFHDGFFGPGTGVFLIFSLLSLRSVDFLRGTGSAKVINLLNNLVALITFAFGGQIDYALGAVGAVGVGTGSYIGARLATRKGTQLIKPIFVGVSSLLIAKLLWNYLAE